MTKFDRQIRYKKRRTCITYTHMFFILTYFHIYWKISVLQDIYKNTMELLSKVRHQRKHNADPLKGNRRKAHVPCKYGPSTNVARTQAQLGAHLHKAVEIEASRGAAAPRVRPHRPQARLAPLFSGGFMASCKGGLRWFPILLAPEPTIE